MLFISEKMEKLQYKFENLSKINVSNAQLKEMIVQFLLISKICSKLNQIPPCIKTKISKILDFNEIEKTCKQMCIFDDVFIIDIQSLEEVLKNNVTILEMLCSDFVLACEQKNIKSTISKTGDKGKDELIDFKELLMDIDKSIEIGAGSINFLNIKDFEQIEYICNYIQKLILNQMGFETLKMSENFWDLSSDVFSQIPEINENLFKVSKNLNYINIKSEKLDVQFLRIIRNMIDRKFIISKNNKKLEAKISQSNKQLKQLIILIKKQDKLLNFSIKNRSFVNNILLHHKKYCNYLIKYTHEIEQVKNRINELSNEVQSVKNSEEKYATTISLDDLKIKLVKMEHKYKLDKLNLQALEAEIKTRIKTSDSLLKGVEYRKRKLNEIKFSFLEFLPPVVVDKKYARFNAKLQNLISYIKETLKKRKNEIKKEDILIYKFIIKSTRALIDLNWGFKGLCYKHYYVDSINSYISNVFKDKNFCNLIELNENEQSILTLNYSEGEREFFTSLDSFNLYYSLMEKFIVHNFTLIDEIEEFSFDLKSTFSSLIEIRNLYLVVKKLLNNEINSFEKTLYVRRKYVDKTE